MSNSYMVDESFLDQDEDDGFQIEDVIQFYLDHNPEPSDEQIHHLGESLGLDFDEFEDIIYEMFTDQVEDLEDEDDVEDELEDQDDDIDPVDLFVIAFFQRNPDPTDQQIHSLANAIGITPEELEEKIYSLLAEFLDD